MLLSKEGIISMLHRQLNWKAQSQTGNIAIVLVSRRLLFWQIERFNFSAMR